MIKARHIADLRLILLVGLACALLQQVNLIPLNLPGHFAATTLPVHLNLGLILAVHILRRSWTVLVGVLAIDAISWCFRLFLLYDGDSGDLLAGAANYALAGFTWTLLCGWMITLLVPPFTRRGLARAEIPWLALIVLLVYPVGNAGIGFLVCDQLCSSIVFDTGMMIRHMCAKLFGVLIMTLPIVIAWTERSSPQVWHPRWIDAFWLLLGISGFALAYVARRASGEVVPHDGLDDAALLFGDVVLLTVFMGWCALRLRPPVCMLLLSISSFVVYLFARARLGTDDAKNFLQLLHITFELGLMQLATISLLLLMRDNDRANRQLREDTRIDSVTGLPNLRGLRDRIHALRDDSPQAPREIGYLLLGQADHLGIAATLDAQAQAMASVADGLADLVDCYYVSVGQFVLVPRDLESGQVLWDLVVVRVEGLVVSIEDESTRLLPFVGVAAVASADAASAEAAIQMASSLATDAREHGDLRPRISSSDSSSDQHLRRRHRQRLQDTSTVFSSLREARVEVYFQPIVPAVACKVQRMHGEILCRLRSASGELLEPKIFIPLVEAAGRAAELDLAVITATFRELSRHGSALRAVGQIGINITGQSLASTTFHREFWTLLDQCPLPLQALCLEVTEGMSILNMPAAWKLLCSVRERGAKIAIDDFGTGRQSFTRLKELPLDILKIDGSFVRGVARRGSDYALVKASVGIARAFNATTVAEFVEDEATADVLRELGVDWLQGYHYGRPQPFAQALAAAARARQPAEPATP